MQVNLKGTRLGGKAALAEQVVSFEHADIPIEQGSHVDRPS